MTSAVSSGRAVKRGPLQLFNDNPVLVDNPGGNLGAADVNSDCQAHPALPFADRRLRARPGLADPPPRPGLPGPRVRPGPPGPRGRARPTSLRAGPRPPGPRGVRAVRVLVAVRGRLIVRAGLGDRRAVGRCPVIAGRVPALAVRRPGVLRRRLAAGTGRPGQHRVDRLQRFRNCRRDHIARRGQVISQARAGLAHAPGRPADRAPLALGRLPTSGGISFVTVSQTSARSARPPPSVRRTWPVISLRIDLALERRSQRWKSLSISAPGSRLPWPGRPAVLAGPDALARSLALALTWPWPGRATARATTVAATGAARTAAAACASASASAAGRLSRARGTGTSGFLLLAFPASHRPRPTHPSPPCPGPPCPARHLPSASDPSPNCCPAHPTLTSPFLTGSGCELLGALL